MIQFNVLGPLRVSRDGAELRVGPAQRGLLLSLLLAYAGEKVPLTEILDVLWGDDPPPTATNVVHRHVGALRRILEPGLPAREPGRWLLSEGGGYRLDVDPDTLDLARFRQLTEQARAAAGAGLTEEAVTAYGKALGLWRAAAVTGLPLEAQAHPVFAGLDRERFAVVEEAATLALETDQAGQILPELQRAAELQPLDELLLTLLVRSLAATGRQAQALRAYQEIRARLADELGVDPGPQLAEVGERLLSGELLAAPTGTAAPAFVPAQLPNDLATFTGREKELADLLGQPSGTLVIGAVGGMAGIGKTTLAVHLAHRVADRYPDGQLYLNLRGFGPDGSAVTPAEAVREFLEALGVPAEAIPVGLDARTALYRSVLADRRLIVLLDNARDLQQVRPLLPGSGGSLVLVTSRNRMAGLVAGHGARLIGLGLVSEDEAADLLGQRLGHDRVAAEPAAVSEIVERCGRLPLALAVVAARAAANPSFPLAAVAAELRAGAPGLDAFTVPDAEADPRAVFSWSYRALSSDAARLFRLLALHPGPSVGVAAMASLAGIPVRQAGTLAGELAYSSLLTEGLPGRYTLHDLLRSYATELMADHDPASEQAAARTRLFDHYLFTGRAATDRYTRTQIPVEPDGPAPGVTPEVVADREAAPAWFAGERLPLRELIRTAAATGHDRHTWQLVWAQEIFLLRRGDWEEAASYARSAVAAADRLGDPIARAHAHFSLGRAETLLRHDDEARADLELSLAMFVQEGHCAGQATVLNYIGYLAERLEHYEEALDYSRQALSVYERIDDSFGQAMALNSIGNLLGTIGDAQGALPYCRRAVKLFRELDDRHGEGAAWDSIGVAHLQLTQFAEAAECFARALELFRADASRNFEAVALDHLGDAQRSLGDLGAARASWHAAATILDDHDRPAAATVRAKSRV
ncbi:tetratricopeptide repeat protein [Actinoplanes sp. LDG1-06]|uniref:Tetratricopeptide repeat protein n=1 Tax=Paractinoplanes ovalisporus TaxID=2810368 RepID=A0ABS2AUS0_9ACTN|nr:BTAD domain-containing putative transcriptional regulator [Actinoplanes ovalisporus]MBM2623624.1 tetratricopeptide repeat protein [Actinoplanes ovalisporus]